MVPFIAALPDIDGALVGSATGAEAAAGAAETGTGAAAGAATGAGGAAGAVAGVIIIVPLKRAALAFSPRSCPHEMHLVACSAMDFPQFGQNDIGAPSPTFVQ
jgi:hypothetical protein